MLMTKPQKRNLNGIFMVGLIFVIALVGIGLFRVATVQQTAVEIEEEKVEVVAVGVPIKTVTVNTRNKDTFTQESGNDVELWVLGSNPADPNDVGLLDVINLTSGTASSTTSTEYKSGDNQNSKDLYFEGGSNYYDKKVLVWKFSHDPEQGLGVLEENGHDYIEITDIGTWKDMDTADTLGTSFADSGTDTLNYNVTDGTGTSSVRWSVGNSEAKSELRLPVLCVGDADGDLEGDELTGLTVSRFSGKSVANLDDLSDVLQMFTESAGTGGDRCIQFGDLIGGSTTGVYEIEFEWAEANCGASEELEISFDDLGNANEREYPSGSVKATKETVTITCIQ